MNCKDVDKLLTAYLEGEATPEEREGIEVHLTTCTRCRDELEALATSRSQLRQALKLMASRVSPPSRSWDWVRQKAGIREGVEKPAPKRLFPALVSASLSVFLLAILVGILIAGMGGMALPPPNPPAVVTDSAGGAFLFWLDEPSNYGSGLYAQHLDAGGNCLWGERGKRLVGESGAPLAVSDGAGGAIIAWGDGSGIYVQMLDSQGNAVWDGEKVLVWSKPVGGWHSLVSIVSDGSGGAILLRETSIDMVYTQRVSADGVLLWGEGGVPIGSIKAAYRGMSMVSDGSGGVVVVWEDSSGEGINLYAQRISHEGEVLWLEGGVPVTTAVSEKEKPQLINDGTGNFIVVWTDISVDTGWDENVYAQKLDTDGNLLWSDTGILICDNPEMQSDPKPTADGSGGCVIARRDSRNKLHGDVFTQRVSATGKLLWQEGRVPLWDISEDFARPSIGNIHITGDGTGSSVVIWCGSRESASYRGNMLYAQKLDADGQRLSGDARVEVYRNPPFRAIGYSSVISDGSGGFITSSRVSKGTCVSNTNSVYAQRVDSEGNRLWEESGLEIQMKHSSPVLPIIAAMVVLVTILVLIGVFRGSRLARIFTAIAPVIIGIVALFSNFLLIGPLGYSYAWAYILNTPLNVAVVAVIPIAGLAIGTVGIWKRTAPKWIMIPIVVFCSLVTVLCALPIVNYLT